MDSNILVYAGLLPKGSSENDRQLMARSRLLFHMHRKEMIILPAIAMSELLFPVSPDRRNQLAVELQQRFVCPPFDARAAAIAADLWAKYKNFPESDKYTRNVARVDALIIASAVAGGATKFYTHDANCRKIASLAISALDLPTRDPDDMFAIQDIIDGDL